ncbi:MAG TPA: 1,4-dihydroxy-2-naphthoate polyprenyltransferase [Myxococcales bacterium]|nr:1,4-dihydroxy-2-naphthoate polyprenyltransferase [Myxococcales bacterium]
MSTAMASGAAARPRPTLSTWVMAFRPKTLSAAVAPVLVGTALAYASGHGRALPALAALVGALLIQIGTNLTNDYYDFKKGADTAERLGPKRVTQSGLIAPDTVLRAAVLAFALAMAVGVYLVAIAGWPILVAGVLSVLCGYAYTGGPYPLGYHGLGDLFVFVFFGLVAVGGTYFVQAGALAAPALVAAVPIGALGTAILAVNNLRDVSTDEKAGKRTLVVRLGVPAGRAEYVAMLGLAFITPLVFWVAGWARAPVLLGWLALPAAVPPLRRVLREGGAALNPALGETARLQLVFAVLFSVGLLLGR